jgi:hypothetical protein
MFGTERARGPERHGCHDAIKYRLAREVWMRAWMLTVALLAGCATDDDGKPGEEASDDGALTCTEAVTHYYRSGCAYFRSDNGAHIPMDDQIANCEEVAHVALYRCQDAFDVWLGCLHEVSEQSRTNEDCDCAEEQAAYFRCE